MGKVKDWIFYHSADFDGMCSGAIVKKYLDMKNQDASYIGINYGDEFPWNKIDKNDTVYMVDFGLQPFEDMVLLNQNCNLIWIDHHKTAIDNIKDSDITFKGVQEVGIGACQMVWEYLFPNINVPYGIQLLALYDVWDHKNSDTLPYQYGLRLYDDTLPESGIWEYVFSEDKEFLDIVLQKGDTVLEYENKNNEIYCKVYSFETEINGLKAIAVNKGITSSKVFDSVWDQDKYDCMLTFSRTKSGYWTCSLYTDKKGVDVSKTAKKYGGGGHLQASGFQCDELPFVY